MAIVVALEKKASRAAMRLLDGERTGLDGEPERAGDVDQGRARHAVEN